MKIQSLNKIIFALLLYWTSVLSFFHLFHSFLVIIQRRDFIGWLNEITWNHKKERMVGSEFDWRLSFFHSPTHLPLALPLLQPLVLTRENFLKHIYSIPNWIYSIPFTNINVKKNQFYSIPLVNIRFIRYKFLFDSKIFPCT